MFLFAYLFAGGLGLCPCDYVAAAGHTSTSDPKQQDHPGDQDCCDCSLCFVCGHAGLEFHTPKAPGNLPVAEVTSLGFADHPDFCANGSLSLIFIPPRQIS
jgi:hypothetical protein